MKNLGAGLRQHLQRETTTLCRCWILETGTGERLGFTDHDEDIVLLGTVCQRSSGMEGSAVEETTGLNPNSAEISGALMSDLLTESDIAAGRYDNGRVSTYLVNWSDPNQYALDRILRIGEIVQDDGAFRMELRGLASELDQTRGRHFTSGCQATLGDGRCRVALDRPQFEGSGAVLASRSGELLEVSGLLDHAAGWFRLGELSWLSGENSGRRIEILDHQIEGETVTLKLWQPTPFAIVDGDTFKVTAGCDKRFRTCREKFSNPVNFQGFPHIPGNRYALGYAGNQDVFDGGAIVE